MAPVLRIATLRDHLDGQHHHLRAASWLLGLCGLASLALAAMERAATALKLLHSHRKCATISIAIP